MSNAQLIAELDMDGVLVDMYGNLETILHEKGYVDFRIQQFKKYTMHNSGIKCPKVIIEREYRNPVLYRTSNLTEGAKEFIEYLLSKGVRVIIHSLAYTEDVKNAKIEMLKDTLGEIFNQIEVIIEVGIIKSTIESTIIVEDNLTNLRVSKAIIKYIFSQPHNEYSNNADYEDVYEEAQYVTSFSEIQVSLEEILDKVG